MRKPVKIIIICVLFIILGYSSYRAYDILAMQEDASNSYDILNDYIQVKEVEEEEIERIEKVKRYLEVDFEALKAENPDFYGWLYLINDEIINYPVVQCEDNSYYLNHLFDGKENVHGTLFLDYRNSKDPLNDNSIIYGHRMQTKTMFHNLAGFKDQKYYEEHPYFYLELPDKEYKLEVFASYVTPAVSDAYVMTFNEEDGYFTDAEGHRHVSYKFDDTVPTFEQWYATVMELNLLKTGIEVQKDDKIFTFSTCDYAFNNARFVVHCKVVETGAK